MEQTKYDVFISYSRKDYVNEKGNVIPNNEVSKIKEALTKAGITYWFDEEGIYSGDNFTEKIVTNIEVSRIFVFLSTYSSNISKWTCREIACADELKKYIIPVRIDQTPYNKKVMFRIADLDYIDYSQNSEKGLHDLISSIQTFLINEKEKEKQKIAAEEVKRKREEAQKKHDRQINYLHSEIDKLELECAEKEKLLLQQQHQVDTTRIELNAKRKRLDEQKAQLNYILYGASSFKDSQTEQSSAAPYFGESKNSNSYSFSNISIDEHPVKYTMVQKIHNTLACHKRILWICCLGFCILIVGFFMLHTCNNENIENEEKSVTLLPIESNGLYGFADKTGKVVFLVCGSKYNLILRD